MELFVSIAETIAWIFVSYLTADFVTGVIHWAEDTWTAPGLVACGCDAWQAYLVLAISSQGNQVHKWAHSSDRPALVRWAQDRGILQSRKHHGKHHTHPYAVHFCALSFMLTGSPVRMRACRAPSPS